MERRKTPRKDWAIGRDDLGRAVLEWRLDARRQELDPCARTYDFLERLDAPTLELEEARQASGAGFDPYDHDAVAPRRRRE